MWHHWLMLLLPEWVVAWFAVGALVAAILGQQRLAFGLGLVPLIDWVLIPVLLPLIDQVPLVVLLPVLALIAITILHGIVQVLFGRETAGQVTGTYLVRLIDTTIRFPFRLLRRLLEMLGR